MRKYQPGFNILGMTSYKVRPALARFGSFLILRRIHCRLPSKVIFSDWCSSCTTSTSTDLIFSNWHHYMTAQLQHFVSVCDVFCLAPCCWVLLIEGLKAPCVDVLLQSDPYIDHSLPFWRMRVSTPSMEEMWACRLERGKKCWVTPQQLPLGQHLQSDQAEEDTCNILFPRRWLGCCYRPSHTLLPVVIHVLRLQNEIWLLDNEHTLLSLA